jgi:hypothetical protein
LIIAESEERINDLFEKFLILSNHLKINAWKCLDKNSIVEEREYL